MLCILGEERRKRGEHEARVSRKGKSAIIVPRGRAPFGQHQESQLLKKYNTEKSAIHELPVTLPMLVVSSNKSDWLRIRNDYSAHALEIGPRLRVLVLTKRRAASGDQNGRAQKKSSACTHTIVQAVPLSDTPYITSQSQR